MHTGKTKMQSPVSGGDPAAPSGQAKARSSVAVLTDDPDLRALAARASNGQELLEARDVEELAGALGAGPPPLVVVDAQGQGEKARDALARLSELNQRAQCFVICVTRGDTPPPPGADLLVHPPALREAIALAESRHEPAESDHIDIDRLLKVSFLASSLDSALEAAADELAAGFGVDRCLISARGDSAGGAATGERTWTSLSWSAAAAHCQTAASAGIPLLIQDEASSICESYVALPLSTPLGDGGFLGLIASRPQLYTAAERRALRAVAERLNSELSWHALHDWAVQELDRLSHGPGLDLVVGAWNRSALLQLTSMQLAAARRTGSPLAALVLDVSDLQSINVRHGVRAGDALLRRLADALRALVREEDVVGRWSGDEVAVVLHGAGPENGRVAAERLLSSLTERPVELPGGESIAIDVTAGIAGANEEDDAERLLSRAAAAAAKAQKRGESIVTSGNLGGTPPRLSQQFEAYREDTGATLGGAYRLIHEISRGGMGVVYRAEDVALERPVAIKMLRPDLAEDAQLVERFRVEASMLAHLQHPNLVQVYSFGHGAGDSYFVMELVEGESLAQAFERCRQEGSTLPLPEVGEVIEQIASALDALHERGIVHRDVKPANVILDPFRSRSVLVDVGIARRYEQRTASAGTPGFVAPEVVGGGEATPRADVYGLAATAYAVLTLQTPWGKGGLWEVLERQRSGEVRPPSSIRPELAAIDQVIVEAMSLDPGGRPASAGAFARALAAGLREVIGGGPPAAEPRQSQRQEGPHEERRKSAADAKTRGVVFRSVAFAVGVRQAEKLRDAIGGEHPDLARALAQDTAPLAWLPTDLLIRLLRTAPESVGRDRLRLARDMARAAVRASFRRFFPASSATLVPERTLSAIRSVWNRYHSWGEVSSMPVSPTEVVVKITDTPRDPALCAWAGGLFEQLVVLSAGSGPNVHHYQCEVRGDEACLFRVTWERRE